jgi:hypothetical protein
VILLFIAFYFADLISAIVHSYYIDSSYAKTVYETEDDTMIINTHYGYASAHHIFPSNYKDINDSTLFTTSVLIICIPAIIIYACGFNPLLSLFMYATLAFVALAPLSHKNAHEKLHSRYVPPYIDIFFKCGIFLSPTHHKNHHVLNQYNWALLNGISDPLFNYITETLCLRKKICPVEENVSNAKLFQNHNNKVKIRFVGDIEGSLQCRLDGNLFIEE